MEQPYQTYDDEISLGDILRGVRSLLAWVRRHWLIIGLCMALGMGATLLWRSMQATQYKATTTLMLSDDGRTSFSGLTGILGQFGIAAAPGRYNIDKLLEISRSRRIIEDVLFQKIELHGSDDYWANHCIDIYDLDQQWSLGEESLEGFRFTNADITSFDIKENYALKKLHSMIAGGQDSEGLLSMDYGREHYVMSYSMTSLSDTLSLEFIRRHFDAVREFYITAAVAKQQQTFDLVLAKRDSIQKELLSVESQIASLRDRGLGSYSSSSSVRLNQLGTQSLIYKQALAEAEKNLAIAQLTLETKTPLVQQIDTPIYPLMGQRPSLLRMLILGVVIGGMLVMVWWLLRLLRA